MEHLFSLEPPPADYPNHLATAEPDRRRLSCPWRLLLLLMVLCVIPRVIVALRLPCICIDGAVYVNTARALDAGNFRDAMMEGAINFYSIMLMVLHRLGFGWEMAGAVWGIAMAALVLPPLWGWVRRQFDDRIALVVCLLYIVHPKFIIESPEVMRDPTFWFLFVSTIYCMWRAIVEVRLRFFFATGAAITLAAFTRVEGLFLLIPLALWMLWRVLALRVARKKLLVGGVACLCAFPLLILAVNAAIFYDQIGWTTIRVSPLARVQPWFQSLLGVESVAEDAANRTPLGRMLWVFFPTMTRGLAPLFALLMFAGIFEWRRVWARRDNQAMFCTAVVILCGIWVQLWCDGNISRRYPLPIVLMASPFAALALLALADRLRRLVRWLGANVRAQHAVAMATVVGVLISGVGHAMSSRDEQRRVAADISSWAKRDFRSPPKFVGPSFMERIVQYYAENTVFKPLPPDADDAEILDMVQREQPDVVVLWPTRRMSARRCESLLDRIQSEGLRPVSRENVTAVDENFYVLVRDGRLECAGNPPQRRH